MNHNLETGFFLVCVLAIGLPFFLHKFVQRFVPPVVVQIFVGVALGPTLLGLYWPEAYAFISDPKILTGVKFIGTLAVTVFAFSIGMHIDAKEFQGGKDMRSLLIVATVSLVVPLLAGLPIGLAFGQQTSLLGPNGTPMLFAVAFAILVSVTALPVLAAITRQMGYSDERVGKTALFCATFNDGALWILLAAFMAFLAAQGSDGASSFGKFVGWSLLYGGVMWWVVRPVLRRLDEDKKNLLQSKHGALVAAITVCFLSSLATHEIGLHALLGAVCAGMVMPEGLKKRMEKDLGRLNEDAMLPFFFVSTGMATKIPLAIDPLFWGLAIGSTVLTVATKLWPTSYMARRTRLLSPLDANKLGSFMAAKGLMEIVVLTIMREVGVISQVTFGAMVMMALLTTAMTMPLVMFFRRHSPRADHQPERTVEQLSTS